MANKLVLYNRTIKFNERAILKLVDGINDKDYDNLKEYDNKECVVLLDDYRTLELKFDNISNSIMLGGFKKEDCFDDSFVINQDFPFELIPIDNYEVDII